MTGKVLRSWGLAIVAVLAIVGLHRTAAAAEARTVLEEILNIMKQSGQITDEQRKALIERAEAEARQAKAEQAKAEIDRMAALQAGIENYRPYLRSGDGNVRIEIGGRFFLDYDAAEGGAKTLTGTDLADRVLTRTARLEAGGRFFRWIDLALSADFAQSVSLKDAYVDVRFMPQLGLRAGQFKVPFSLEELISARFSDFVERSILNDVAPARDAGVMLHGNLFSGVAGYAFGVFNGSGENTADTGDSKDLAGRVTLSPLKPTGNYWLKGLQLGGNFTWGDQNAGTSAPGRTSARTSSRFTYFAAQQARGDRTRLGGDLAWLVGPASLKVEYAEQANERERVGALGVDLDDVTATGWYVSATYLLTGEDKPLAGPVVPRRFFNPVGGTVGPGAWELALRYAELDFSSDDPVDFFDGNITDGITGGGRTAENGGHALTAGVNWYWNPRMRTMFNWTHYWYDNPRGTPFSCPGGFATCGAGQLRRVDDPTSWEVLSRIQLWF